MKCDCTGENMAQEWTSAVQGGGWNVENIAASEHCTILWLFWGAAAERQTADCPCNRADDIGHT